MRTIRTFRLGLTVVALALLGAPLRSDAVACSTSECLVNSAVSQRVQPTSVTTDDKGDVTFFASQSGQLPNVLLILDNSTSMYELPYNLAPFPNTGWLSGGTTPVGSGATKSGAAASCHSNTFFEGLKDASGNKYNKSTTYAPPDSAFSTYFTSGNYYKYMEWNTTSPGGSGPGGLSPTAACNAMSSSAGSGGSGGILFGLWSMTERERCQQCLDEAGYYLKPAGGGGGGGAYGSQSDVTAGYFVFKGNWLNFDPPKFIQARKVLTDFISSQTSSPTPVRIGVVTYDPNNISAMDQPSATTGLRANDGGAFISAGMIPDCGVTSWSGASSQQTTLLSNVRAISFGSMNSPIATPLAETLFNVGQFFSGGDTYYTSTFGSKWIKSAFTAPSGNNKPLCVSCQVNGVVLITDGSPYGDNNLPQTFRNDSIKCPTGLDCGTDGANNSVNLLDDVANFLATTDLNATLTGTQDVITFVIGLGISVPLLDNTARYGKTGSKALTASNYQELLDAVTSAVVNVVARATAFSSTAIQTLEVGTGSTAYVPRFIPGSTTDGIWDGHLYRFDLLNEFVAGIDKNGDGKKDGVFLVDKDGDIITEDDKGAFHKSINGQPGAPAVPVWDAGVQLNATAANSRIVYTAVTDSSGNWSTIRFDPSSSTSISSITSYLGLTTAICNNINAQMATPLAARYSPWDASKCVLAVMDYVIGLNVLNQNLSNSSTTINRPHVLGDIFHSSPVVVEPPVDQWICDRGLHSQCVLTLYADRLPDPNVPPTKSAMYSVGSGSSAKQVNAYEKYLEDHQARRKIVLVGANDGMLHAFDAGTPADNPPAQDPSSPVRNIRYGSGTGNEAWAFIPPDQLPRLWRMLVDGHQIYMDGDIMVRDIWVDGKANDKGTSSFANDPLVKQDVEYHTVAVAGERQGGNHFVALDVTDTDTPKMLWMFPPPCSTEEQVWGQTFGQFSPGPPPIGPVLLQTSQTAGLPRHGFDHTEERYAVFLNGGRSPFNTRGRAFAMLDAYTGSVLYEAVYDSTSTGTAGQLKWAFPATGALVDYSGSSPAIRGDGFFDTGVVGDEGGNLWAIRMLKPGHLAANGLVDNWTFGRAYEPKSAASNEAVPRQAIYALAATTVVAGEPLRAFVGTGDRSHVRSTGGGDCRPDDPTSCLKQGCTVNSTLTLDSGPNRYTSTFSGSTAGGLATVSAPTQVASTTINACNVGNATENITVTLCPSSSMNLSENLAFSCSGSPLSCTDGAFIQPTPNMNRGLASSTAAGRNTFLSIAVLSDTALCTASGTNACAATRARTMDLPADAAAYDQYRFTLSELVDVTAVTATTTGGASSGAATDQNAGWFLTYGSIDEKTVTSATIQTGCVVWSSLVPTGGAVGCASSGSTVAPFYQAAYNTGAPSCSAAFLDTAGTTYARSIQRNVLSPPPEPAAAVSIGAGFQVRFSTLEIQPGAGEVTQITTSTTGDPTELVSTVPITKDQHDCRHAGIASKCR